MWENITTDFTHIVCEVMSSIRLLYDITFHVTHRIVPIKLPS